MDTNCAVSDYTNQKDVQECDLVGLPDLDTSSTKVQDRIAQYLNYMYELGVKGFRIDAAKHQEASQVRVPESRKTRVGCVLCINVCRRYFALFFRDILY